jgi:hypothetical protein
MEFGQAAEESVNCRCVPTLEFFDTEAELAERS